MLELLRDLGESQMAGEDVTLELVDAAHPDFARAEGAVAEHPAHRVVEAPVVEEGHQVAAD